MLLDKFQSLFEKFFFYRLLNFCQSLHDLKDGTLGDGRSKPR